MFKNLTAIAVCGLFGYFFVENWRKQQIGYQLRKEAEQIFGSVTDDTFIGDAGSEETSDHGAQRIVARMVSQGRNIRFTVDPSRIGTFGELRRGVEFIPDEHASALGIGA